MADYPIIFSAPMILSLLAGRKTMTRRLAWTPYSPRPPKERQPPRAVPRNVVMLPGRAGGFSPSVWQKVKPGDRLWVREAWNLWHASRDGEEWWPARTIPKEDPRLDEDARGHSCVDFPVGSTNGGTDAGKGPWRPAFYLPRWASRITILVEQVKREPLQAISADDALAEGATGRPGTSGFMNRYEGWSMDWSSIGTLSPWAMGATRLHKAPLQASDISLGSPQAAFASYWTELHGPAAWQDNPEVVAMAGRVELRNIDAPPLVAA